MEPAPALRATSLWYERFPRALPFGIFALVMAVTLLSVAAIENAETRRRFAQLEQVAEATASAIERQAEASSAYLRAGAAVLGTQQRVSGPLFQTYVSQLRLDSDRSGSEGLGWAMRVDTADVEVVEQGMRKFGQRGFTIRPRPTGDRAFAVAVMYLQPDDERNRRALGGAVRRSIRGRRPARPAGRLCEPAWPCVLPVTAQS